MSPQAFALHAACIRGVDACPVTVEVAMAGGLPGISIVGMADAAVLEARSRIRCAMRAAGFEVPRKSITVNLAPGDMRKTGSGFDLPIAVAILAASSQIPVAGLDGCLLVGELALDGAVCPVKGEVAYQILARDADLELLGARSEEHVAIDGIRQGYLRSLDEMRSGVEAAHRARRVDADLARVSTECCDYADVLGQEMVKRGIAVAAAGDLGLLMIGAPGSGKSMLARRMTTILPELAASDQQDALRIHSVAGEPIEDLMRGRRPFRCPHHSISLAGLIGGGRPVRPGEISLAHGGVLFLDELAEFPAHVLQGLRQPLEEGQVRIVRVDGLYAFPASFQLLAASNPCPCGYLGDRDVPCTCRPDGVQRYRAKLGGPLADRIDLMIDVARPDPRLIIEGAQGLDSAEMRRWVSKGRSFRAWRVHGDPARMRPHNSGEQTRDSIGRAFDLDDRAERAVLDLARRTHLTGRGISRLCRIARTIADMEESMRIQTEHVLEAAMYQGRRQQ
ncbi:Mg chelatase, subunit ChlI [Coriobacterium glomerans PW2]|uniref:Mg chelatase, subunit ChlI n=1 Tax=Coriobacterium glomerans (strain ATCC 49209 / DSM 20642 / JCM 10262 / PW2) TaxID=700015 RepID=F2N9G4_CORGP|nr:YifB family Mg chelatase-like AAA ATPase [Coriobacterium glomerans]AEB06993.1 Mg chelatase, subunit ChlI [Coriobacterium glomerans PW2]